MYYSCKLKVVGKDAHDVSLDPIDEGQPIIDLGDWIDEGINAKWYEDIEENTDGVLDRYSTWSITFGLKGIPEIDLGNHWASTVGPFEEINQLCLDNDLYQAFLLWSKDIKHPIHGLVTHIGIYWVPKDGDGFYSEDIGPLKLEDATKEQIKTIEDINAAINNPDSRKMF